MEYRKGLPQSRKPWHTAHCLDALRREVICNADDTPRASTHEFSPNTGVGQYRKCKSWDKMTIWAIENTACFKFLDPSRNVSNLERYKFCPKDSPYSAQVESYERAGLDI